jgi:HK97 family phage prohead protease
MSIATGLERKSLTLRPGDLSGPPDGPGSYRIYAAIFNNIDRSGEMIAPAAFTNLPEFVRNGFMALGHDWKSIPIATIDSAVADHHGLLVSGTWHSHPEAQAARQAMRERLARGKTCAASIGYTVRDDARVVQGGKSYRLLKDISLFELSWVNVPCNPLAMAVDVKGSPAGKWGRRAGPGDPGRARAEFDRTIREAKIYLARRDFAAHAPGFEAARRGEVDAKHAAAVRRARRDFERIDYLHTP